MKKPESINLRQDLPSNTNLYFLIISLISLILELTLSFSKIKLPPTVSLPLIQLVILFIPLYLYIKTTKKSFKKTLRLNKVGFKTILIVILCCALFFPVANFFSKLAQFIFPDTISKTVTSMNNQFFLIQLLIVAILPAIFEELTFRGVILSGLNGVSIAKASIVVGLFFGLFHGNGHQFFYTFPMGILLGYIVRITNSIFPAMIFHFINNSFGITLTHILSLQGEASPNNSSTNFSILPIALTALICLAIIILLVRILMKIHKYNDFEHIQKFKETNNIEGNINIINWSFILAFLLWICIIILQFIMKG